MRRAGLAVTGILMVAIIAGAQESELLRVQGRGVEGRPAYRGGGVVKLLDATTLAQLVHYDGKEAALPLQVRYQVLEPAPILLTSRFGSEYWQLYHFATESMAQMYTDEKIELADAGPKDATSTRAWFNTKYTPLPASGLVSVRGHYYFLIDQPDGRWLDVTDPPRFFDQATIARQLTFTLADLSSFSLAVSEIQSSWQPGGPVRVKVTVTDAQGKTMPVINVPLTAMADDRQIPLDTEWGPLDEPTGWMRGQFPQRLPEKLAVQGTVAVQTPAGLEKRQLSAVFAKGQGQVSADQLKSAQQGYELPRNRQGTVRETRAIWISGKDIETAEKIDQVVSRCVEARLNTLIPSIFVRNTFLAKSPIFALSPSNRTRPGSLGATDRKGARGRPGSPSLVLRHLSRSAFPPMVPRTARYQRRHGGRKGQSDPAGRRRAPAGVPRFHGQADGGRGTRLRRGRHPPRLYSLDGQVLLWTVFPRVRQRAGQAFNRGDGPGLAARWQRQAIGDIVRRTAEGTRRARPQALMSAAVFSAMPSGAAQGQDPANWARQGWMDLILPMDYRMQTLQVRSNERQFLAALDDDDVLVTGLSLYQRSGGEVSSRPSAAGW